MKKQNFTLSVNLPSVDEFAERFKQYGKYAKGENNEDYGKQLFDLIVSPESFNNARVATLVLKLPALIGVAEICYETVLKNAPLKRQRFLRQFIGAVVCKLMEDNGFKKTGTKKSVPHNGFSKAEFYVLA
jgi:hypothetical protein